MVSLREAPQVAPLDYLASLAKWGAKDARWAEEWRVGGRLNRHGRAEMRKPTSRLPAAVLLGYLWAFPFTAPPSAGHVLTRSLQASLLVLFATPQAAEAGQQAEQPAPASEASNAEPAGKRPVVEIKTSKGVIKVELFPEQAPQTVANFLKYVDDGFYDDTIFHRVINGFVIQGGGYTPELESKTTRAPVEIESDNGLKNVRGTIAMARDMGKDSATSQFYINVGDNAELDRTATQFGYTVFGRVIEGMQVVVRIARVQTSRRGMFDDIPILPVFIEAVRRVE